MSLHISLLCLCIITLFSILDTKFLQSSILSLNTFSLNTRCVLPMLGQAFAEFQVNKNSHVLAIVDIAKIFESMGIPNNSETNPNNIKSINIVFRPDLNKLGLFWTNTKNEVFVTRPPHSFAEIISPCTIWLKDLITISDDFEKSSNAPLVKDEATFGNNKYAYKDINAEVDYGYIFQDDNLTALTQTRGPSAAILANIIAFVESSRFIEIKDMMVIPDGIEYVEH